MTSVSNTISTQTTTFLPKCPSVLQRKEIRATFVKKLARVVSKKAVSIIKTNKINSKQAAQNKKTLLKIVREMTLNIRKERVEKSKAEKIDRLAAKEITQVEKEQAKAEKIVRFAVKEITKAEREAKKNLAVRKAWEEMTQRLAIDAPGAVFSRPPLVVE